MTDRAEAMDRRLGGYSVFFITVIGVWLLIGPLAPEWSGYGWMERTLGGEAALVRFFTAFLFLYFAGIVREKNVLRHTLHGMMQALRAHMPVQDPAQVRHAVDILIRSVGAESPEVREKVLDQLRRLTGKDLGESQGAWQAWWDGARDTFVPPPKLLIVRCRGEEEPPFSHPSDRKAPAPAAYL